MSFLRRFPLLAYTLVFLSLLAFNYASENYGLLVFSLVAALVSWWMVENGNGPPVPRWIINTGVLVVAMVLFWELVIYKQSNMLLGLGHFMDGLIICKLFEKKSNRDYGQILLLSLLLILSGAILTVSPIYAILLLVYLVLGLYTSLVFHLQCETQRAMQRHAAADRMMIMPGQQAVMARDMRRISMGASVFLFVFACGIFVLFPRTNIPGLLASWRIGGTTATGLTQQIQLGKFGQLQQSNAIVGEVRLEQNGQNIGGNGNQPYFMSSTENFYDAGTHEWIHARNFHRRSDYMPTGKDPPDRAHHPATLSRRKMQPGHYHHYLPNHAALAWQHRRRHHHEILLNENIPTANLVPDNAYINENLITQTYTLNNFQSGPLLSICPAVTISSPDFQEVTRMEDGTILIRGNFLQNDLTYTVQSPSKYDASLIGPQKPELFPTTIAQSMFEYNPDQEELKSAPIPKRIVALAKKIVGPLLKIKRTSANAEKIDKQLVNKFNEYMRKSYPYSFDMTPVDPDIDPTVDFLFNKKKIGGYCEYFASAMVMFCRSVKIPARIVSGFHGGDYNPVGGYYVIRKKYAHAWVQAWIPHEGWIRFDPSPLTSLTGVESKITWFSEIADFFQWMKLKWLHNVITFNQTMRKAIIGRIETFAEAVMQTVRHYVLAMVKGVTGIFKGSSLTNGFKIIIVLGLLAIIAFCYFIYLRWKRRRGVAISSVRTMDRKIQRRMIKELIFIDRLMNLLNHTGIVRQPDQTPREYVHVVGIKTGIQLPEALRLVGYFYDIRFGTSRMTPQINSVIKQDIAATEERLRQRPRMD